MKLRISNCGWRILLRGRGGKNPQSAIRNPQFRSAFTLIEIMIVVGIIGLIAAMGMPAIMKALQKEGMRKALSDISDVCASARAKAIFSQKPVAVIFHPADRTFSSEGGNPGSGSTYVTSSTLPDGVDFDMLDINQENFLNSDPARVWFNPNGTSDEMTLVLHDKTDWRKITLEFSTAFTSVSDVNK